MPTENHNAAAEAVALADAADVRAADALREAAHAAAVEYEARALYLRRRAKDALTAARCTAEPGDVLDLALYDGERIYDATLVSYDAEHVVVLCEGEYLSRRRATIEGIYDAETGDDLRLPT